MASAVVRISCVALLAGRAAAINAGGFPFANVLPRLPSKDELLNKALGRNLPTKENPLDMFSPDTSSPKGDAPALVAKGPKKAEGNASASAEKDGPKSVVQRHEGPEAPGHKSAAKRPATPATPSEVLKPPSTNGSAGPATALVKQKDSLLRSASLAMEIYASALADAREISAEQRKAGKSAENADKVVQRELSKLQDVKRHMLKVTREDMQSSPLKDSYNATQEKMAKSATLVADSEKRVTIANQQAISAGKAAEEAASRLQQSLSEKAKHEVGVRDALKAAENLAARLVELQEQNSRELRSLEGYAKELDDEGAALTAVVGDASKPPKAAHKRQSPPGTNSSHTTESVSKQEKADP